MLATQSVPHREGRTMKPTFQIALALTFFGCLALRQTIAAADTPATTAVHRSIDSAVHATPVGYYRPYRGYYRSYYRPYVYRPYYAYRPYVYRPYVYPPYAYPAYGYGYPYSIRSPYYFGYRYPGAYARGYYGRPRVYFSFGW
jgi:hypothetical protein